MLDVVRNNYDSLTLKLQDNLDVFERYKETSSAEKTFFTSLVSVNVSVNEYPYACILHCTCIDSICILVTYDDLHAVCCVIPMNIH